jgi:hypothetical protein
VTRHSGVEYSIPPQGPLADELGQLFDVLPLDPLVATLEKHGRGPKGYPVRALIHAFISSYYLDASSIADMVRKLQDNPALAEACGFEYPYTPSRSTLSRFFARLAQHRDVLEECLAAMTEALSRHFPRLGETMAIDSTDIRSWSHATGMKQSEAARTSDPEAGWAVKGNVAARGGKEYTWGYKFQLIIDANLEIPLYCFTTPGNRHDFHALIPGLHRLHELNPEIVPEYVLADTGYDAEYNYEACLAIGAIPLIRGRRSAGAAKTGWEVRPYNKQITDLGPRAKDIYNRRTAVERVFSRLKQTRRLRDHRYRGLDKVGTHCFLAVLTFQAKVLAQANVYGLLRQCLRKVA